MSLTRLCSFAFSYRLAGSVVEAIDALFLSARLGVLSGDDGGVLAGGGDVIGMSFLFVFRIGLARRWRFVPSLVSLWRPVRIGVLLLVSSLVPCWRFVRVSWIGVSCRRFVCRVGVSFVVSALASRLSSCVGVLLLVSCRRSVLSGVSCRCCPVAPFLSARVPVSSRLFSPLMLFSVCSSRRACRMASGRCGVAVGRFVVAVGRAIWVLRGDMRCEAAWRRAVR